MKRKKYTCEKARECSIEKTLENLGYFPSRKSEKEAWYFSPFRAENKASFKVSLVLNRWYDHGMGKGGNVIDLIVALKNYTIPEALEFLNTDKVDFSFQQPTKLHEIKKDKNYEVTELKSIQNTTLLSYLKSRCVKANIAKKYCREIHYNINNKKYFAIAFQNESNGYEIRNKYFQSCFGTKAITHVKNGSKSLCIFEGFIDFLSYLSYKNISKRNEDYLILNSVALIEKATEKLKDYNLIYAYLDNDTSGVKATNILKKRFVNVVDCSFIFKGYKDLNEYLMSARVY